MKINKTVPKSFRITIEENKKLKEKAKKVGMTDSSLIRELINGFEPKAKPDQKFYDAMFQMRSIANSLNQIARKAHVLGFIDKPYYMREAEKWNKFMIDIKKEYLVPKDTKN